MSLTCFTRKQKQQQKKKNKAQESSNLTCIETTMRCCRYRFMVIDRLGVDLQKKFEECGKMFPRKLVLQLGLRLVSGFVVTVRKTITVY